MRGKVPDIPPTHDENRITPAYAGKRQGSYFKVAVIEDHPRLCGEKCCWTCFERQPTGSPPPMRGKGRCTSASLVSKGITPAYAGKRRCQSLWSQVQRGSPPPMRGKVCPSAPPICPHRITPAYAGKSRCCTSRVPTFWDHPRLCGEKCIGKSWIFRRLGSPPPMRGKVRGKGLVRHRTQDHPRLCGEKLFAAVNNQISPGSPPPMRGKVVHGSMSRTISRITPAYAGKS